MEIKLLETFLTGHDVIDAEHARIVSSINSVSKTIENGQFGECTRLLDDFLNICAAHFNTEETLLAKLRYPDLEEHAVFHKELILKAKAVRVLCMDANDPQSLAKCFDEMAALLVEDVIKGDMAFVSFLIEKGEAKPRDLHVMPIPKHELPDDIKS